MDVLALSISIFSISCMFALAVYKIVDGFDVARRVEKNIVYEVKRIEKDACKRYKRYVAFIASSPIWMYLDHDLGEKDEKDEIIMTFLKWLSDCNYKPTFYYTIISSNPEGSKSIKSFIDSWKRICL